MQGDPTHLELPAARKQAICPRRGTSQNHPGCITVHTPHYPITLSAWPREARLRKCPTFDLRSTTYPSPVTWLTPKLRDPRLPHVGPPPQPSTPRDHPSMRAARDRSILSAAHDLSIRNLSTRPRFSRAHDLCASNRPCLLFTSGSTCDVLAVDYCRISGLGMLLT
jgi:hypothetical protein